VAVGGRVVATTLTYDSPEGGVSFTAMIPPAVGRVEVLAITGPRGRRRLERLTSGETP
jgi:hypothetical protein